MNKTTQFLSQLKNRWNDSPTTRNILKVSVGDIGSKILSAAIILILIRSLSVNDYATYTTFSGISFLFSGIVGAGLNMAVVRFSSDHLSRGNAKPLSLYFFAILFQLTLYILLAGICLLFPAQSTTLLFGQQTLALPFQLGLLAGLGLLIMQFVRSLYQAEERFNNYIGTLWLVQVIIFISLILLWLFHQISFLPVAIIFAAVQFGVGAWLLVRSIRDLDFSNLIDLDLEQRLELKQFLTGSAWLIGYFLILNLFSRMDVLMLLHFRTKEELAVYGVAFQYYSLSLLFLGSIHAVLLPKFARADMQQPEKQKGFLRQWLGVTIWLFIPIALFDLFGKPLFVWINGITYASAFPIFIVFSIGIGLSMMLSPLVNIIIGRGEYHFLFWLAVAALCLNFLCNIWLVPSLGGLGAAIVIILTQNIFIQFAIVIKILRSL